MKNLSRLIVICLVFLGLSQIAFAHPGRTDSSGGHYVRKSGWGYPVGSYHYHNSGSSTSSSNTKTSKSNSTNYDSGALSNSYTYPSYPDYRKIAKTYDYFEQEKQKFINTNSVRLDFLMNSIVISDIVCLYSLDGKIIDNVKKDKIDNYGCGWYIRKYIDLIASDGRKALNVPTDKIGIYGSGWSIDLNSINTDSSKPTGFVVTLYSLDGRSIENVPLNDVSMYGSGWYFRTYVSLVSTYSHQVHRNIPRDKIWIYGSGWVVVD